MQWNDRAIILSVKKFSEHSAVVTLLSREHGIYSGVAKAALSKKQCGTYQSGNWVHASWRARLDEHMGSLQCDLEKPVAALAMHDRLALAGLNAVCAMMPLAMHERDPHPWVFDAAAQLLRKIACGEEWVSDYVRFEVSLLRDAGFGLDLTQCVASGVRSNLMYVSPKSGCAVSAVEGEPYKNKLLPLPAFLLQDDAVADLDGLKAGFRLTTYFFTEWMLAAHGGKMPAARIRLVEMLVE